MFMRFFARLLQKKINGCFNDTISEIVSSGGENKK
jgi:hypothetical protein